MKFKYYTDMFAKTLDFKGRSKVAEYWVCVLYNIIFSSLVVLVGLPFVKDWNLFMVLSDALSGMYYVIVFLPMLALTIRRLHDANHSGWSVFLVLIPIVGLIILIIYLVAPSVQTSQVWNNQKCDENVLLKTSDNQLPADMEMLQNNIENNKQNENVIYTSKQPQENHQTQNYNQNQQDNNTKTEKVIKQPQEIEPAEIQKNSQPVKQTKPRAKKSSGISGQETKEKPKTRSEKIAELQQKQQNGEITPEEYHKQVMEILKH